MNPTEIIKPEIVGPVVAAVPFTNIIKRMLGPAADEVGAMLQDRVRQYRYELQLKGVEKAAKMAEEAGFIPNAVPPKILFPLLEGMSMEEDETLHDMWSALLANASSSMAGAVRPGFIATLKQLAPDEAAVLAAVPLLASEFKKILVEKGYDASKIAGLDLRTPTSMETYTEAMNVREDVVQRIRVSLPRFATEDEAAENERFDLCVHRLKVAGLIVVGWKPTLDQLELTTLGEAFLAACTAPKPRPAFGRTAPVS